MTTGARSSAVIRMSGCSPLRPAMVRVLSERISQPCIMRLRIRARAVFALGSVCRGMFSLSVFQLVSLSASFGKLRTSG